MRAGAAQEVFVLFRGYSSEELGFSSRSLSERES